MKLSIRQLVAFDIVALLVLGVIGFLSCQAALRYQTVVRQLRQTLASHSQPLPAEMAEVVEQLEQAAQRFVWTIGILGPVSLGILGAALFALTRDMHKREHAEAALQQERVTLRAILSSMTEGVIVVDEAGRLAMFNPAAEAMHGLGRTDTSPHQWSETYGLFYTDQVTPLPEAELPTVRALRGETIAYTELYQRLPGESKGRFFANAGGPIIDEFGQQRGGVIVVTDITARRESEDKLRRSEEAYRELYDQAPCGYYSIDETGTIVAMNATALNWLGFSADEVLGVLPVTAIIDGEDRASVLERLSRVKESGKVSGVLRTFRRRDGSKFAALLSSIAVRDAQGTFLRTHTTIFDLTERHQAERRFQSLLESAPDALVIVNAAGEIVLINSQAEKLFGYARQELLGKSVEKLFPVRLLPPGAAPILDCLGSSAVQTLGASQELYAVRADGTEFPAEVNLSPVDWGEGVLISAAVRDVTERQRILREVRELNEQLEQRVAERTSELQAANVELAQRNQENEMFVYSVSHDLRSPLVNLQGFSQELRESYRRLRELCACSSLAAPERTEFQAILDRDIDESLHFIQSSVERLGGMINALLRLSRAGRVVYQWQRVDTQSVVQRVVDSLRSSLSERAAQLTIDELPPVFADATALEQVFANLLQNALNYLSPTRAGRIRVGCDGADTFFVEDNGIGIPADKHARIFQAFQRLHPELAPGEGLGLALVQRIVERHGGRLWVESQPDQGSRFCFTVPNHSPAQAARGVVAAVGEQR